MAAMAKIVCLTSVFTAWNSLSDFCDLMQSHNSMNKLHLRLFISVRCRRRRRQTFWVPMDLERDGCHGTQAAIFV